MREFIKVITAVFDPNPIKTVEILSSISVCAYERQTPCNAATYSVARHLKTPEGASKNCFP